jgi:hypothetical protein
MAATRETVIIPGPADHLTVLAQDGKVERYEFDRLKILRAALLALHSPRLVDHLMSGTPRYQYNCPAQPPEHFACHFLHPASCFGSFVRTVCFLLLPLPFVIWRVSPVLLIRLVKIAHLSQSGGVTVRYRRAAPVGVICGTPIGNGVSRCSQRYLGGTVRSRSTPLSCGPWLSYGRSSLPTGIQAARPKGCAPLDTQVKAPRLWWGQEGENSGSGWCRAGLQY